MTIRSALVALSFGVAALAAVPASAATIVVTPVPNTTVSGSTHIPPTTTFTFTIPALYKYVWTVTLPGGAQLVSTGGPGTYNDTISLRGDGGTVLYSLFEGIAAPEAATWSMMFLGIGLMGATLRRRRQAPALTAA
jgi:hypothetical protein